MHRRPGARHALAGLLLAGLALLAVGPLAPAASAHDVLISTRPAAGSTVPAPPEVRLTFAEKAMTLGSVIRVSGPSGVVSSGAVRLDGDDVVESLRPDLAPGGYTVQWRVTSADGHPVSGTFRFTVTRSTTATSGSATSAATSTGPAATTAAASGSGGGSDSAGVVPAWPIGVAVLLLGGLVAGVLTWRRR